METTTTTKLTKNQFKCFQCRLVFAQKDGDWFDRGNMQVHLCRGCEKQAKAKEKSAHAPSLNN